MKTRISPEIELIFSQLLRLERRRSRTTESVGAHFGHALVKRILEKESLIPAPLAEEPQLESLIDDRTPEIFVRDLAFFVESHEAATVAALRKHVSIYREHVDEQILFGARTAGQEAGRSFLTYGARGPLTAQEAVQAVFEMAFTGLPGEKNYFLSLRTHGGSTVHYARSPHLEAWKSAAESDPAFLSLLQNEWIRGILDILSPQTEFCSAQSIEQGSPFGLEHFFLRGEHAGP